MGGRLRCPPIDFQGKKNGSLKLELSTVVENIKNIWKEVRDSKLIWTFKNWNAVSRWKM